MSPVNPTEFDDRLSAAETLGQETNDRLEKTEAAAEALETANKGEQNNVQSLETYNETSLQWLIYLYICVAIRQANRLQ